MQKINLQNRIKDIKKLEPYYAYMIYTIQDTLVLQHILETPIKNLPEFAPSINSESVLVGLQRLSELAEKRKIMYDIYTMEECVDDAQKKNVKIFFMPAVKEKRKKNAPFIIINAGGGYTSVCSVVEAFPTAAYFNSLGYNVFCLNYRVGGEGILPKPIEDLAAAYTFICDNYKIFELNTTDYVVCGFSAGANLTCLWGTDEHGFSQYKLKKPIALFSIYTGLNLKYVDDNLEKSFARTMFGSEYTQEDIDNYDLEKLINKNYPPTYIVHCKDDSLVHVKNSIRFKEILDEEKIFSELEMGEKGGHGFGDGRGTDVEGWPERAICFLEKLNKDN